MESGGEEGVASVFGCAEGQLEYVEGYDWIGGGYEGQGTDFVEDVEEIYRGNETTKRDEIKKERG